jgi:mannose-6-phosphate isomerase-like protein (cupin superfamily)
MRRSVSGLAFLLAVSWLASAVAQTPGTTAGGLVLKPTSAASGEGISNVALLNEAGARVLRVDIAPNGVRNVHSHDDVDFHLFVPVSGTVRLEVAGKQMELGPWQAQFIKGGTKHGFVNTGSTTATVMEVFVKK